MDTASSLNLAGPADWSPAVQAEVFWDAIYAIALSARAPNFTIERWNDGRRGIDRPAMRG
ncbi:MAG: hypothetical protein ABFD16_23440 [Thermoguttaceae bacterium]